MTAGDVFLRSPTLEVGVLAHGARLTSVRSPDRTGRVGDLLLGLADAAAYQADRAYLGASVGRFANRIAGGTFTLDGVAYKVPTNEPGAALHGGDGGFDAVPWEISKSSDSSVTLHRTSPDGENGFPGTLDVTVVYTVDGPDLSITHTAETDAPTVVNLTNHGYWNLAGGGSIEGHRMQIRASHYLPVDEHLIPTGERAPVQDTPFDFRAPTAIGARLREAHPQLRAARGYDHTFVLDGAPGPEDLYAAARVHDPGSGRYLEVFTDQPGVQFYSGNFLDGTIVLRDGRPARQSDAFCLETQAFPDSPNQPGFPSTVLRPGQLYRSRTLLRFGVR
jgi:aldose 1-epimerase